MTINEIITSLEKIRNSNRDNEEDMWREENAILEGEFRETADELDHLIGELESIADAIEKAFDNIWSVV